MKKYLFFTLIFVLFFASYKAFDHYHLKNRKISITFSGQQMPYTTDPLLYDFIAHHFAFRSVYATLFSTYKLGKTIPILASAWTVPDEYMTWRFTIRKDMKFASGEPITPKIVWQNFMRSALLMKQQGSHSGLLEYLENLEKLTSLNSNFSGLSYDDHTVTLKFKVPLKDVINKISFGLYAIANPNKWDSDGKWKDPKDLDASGPYKIIKWQDSQINYQLRDDYPPDLRHENAAKYLTYIRGVDIKENVLDIFTGSQDVVPVGNYQFEGPTPSSIRYAACQTWRDKSSICGTRKNRQILRDLFLRELEKTNFKFAKSFFPLLIQGIKQNSFTTKEDEWQLLTKKQLTFFKYVFSGYVMANPTNVIDCVGKAADSLSKNFGLSIEFKTIGKDLKEYYTTDVVTTSTGILVDNPIEDIRFMFLSKHGIQLPDETGEIIEELNKTHMSIQRINELLWEQAIIWPLGHSTRGLWIKQDAGIDIRQYNSLNPPIDFAWIGVQ